MARGKVRPPSPTGRVTGKVCSIVCGYDKVKVGQNANRGAWNTSASKAEAARLDLTPTAPAAYAEHPAVDRVFRKGPPRVGLCRRLCSLQCPRSRSGWTAVVRKGLA